jgi:mRNA interferase YafQ
MTSKKAPNDRRAALPRASDRTQAFVKDWTRLSHSGRYDLRRLEEVMLLLIANDAPLNPEWLDHSLSGDWADHRECHVGGDFLLIYRLDRASANAQIKWPSPFRGGITSTRWRRRSQSQRNACTPCKLPRVSAEAATRAKK